MDFQILLQPVIRQLVEIDKWYKIIQGQGHLNIKLKFAFLRNRWANQSQILCVTSIGRGNGR